MAMPPPLQVTLAQRFGKKYGVDPRLLLAIGGHETQWGTTGAGRPSQGGYALGYGVTDSGILSKYAGLQNQYRYGAKTLAGWGVHGLADIQAGKASRWATDPNWEKGVASVYQGIGGKLPAAPSFGTSVANAIMPGPAPPTRRQMAAPRVQRWTDTVFDPGKLAQGIFSSLAAGGTPDVASLVGSSTRQQTFSRTLPPVPVGGKMRAANGVHTEGIPLPQTKAGAGIVSLAAKQLGQPYVWGGESRKEGGFDCSGLIDWAMRQQGYKGPRLTTYSIANMGVSVRNKPLRPGDMVLSNGGEHVSIYAGNGKCIVAPHTGAVVRWQPLSDFHVTDIRRV
jgi:cell wall-associated NlpC family hydrolase